MKTLILFLSLVGIGSSGYAKTEKTKIQLADRIEIRHEKGRVQYKICQMNQCQSIGREKGYSKAEIENTALNTVASETGYTPPASVGQLISDGYGAAQGNEELVAEFLTPFEAEIGPVISVYCPLKKEINDLLVKVEKSKNRNDYLFELGDYKEAGCGAFMESNPGRVKDIAEGLKKFLK